MDIGTRRLRLRPVTPGDARLLHLLDSDPEVMRYVSGGGATPASTIVDWVIPRSQAQFRNHGTGLWVAFDLRTGRFAGWVWLRVPRHSAAPELELSYRLDRSSWHRGLATEAASALITVAFASTAVERIFASTHPDNLASQRVMRKLGMRLATAHLRREQFDDGFAGVDDGFVPADVEYEVLRADWARGRGRPGPARRGRHHRGDPHGSAGMTA